MKNRINSTATASCTCHIIDTTCTPASTCDAQHLGGCRCACPCGANCPGTGCGCGCICGE